MSADESRAPAEAAAGPDADAPAVLAVEAVSKHFAGLQALDGVSMTVREGEIVGLIGPNGAGKTTLFNCISGTYRPSGGRVLLDGENVTGLAPHRMAARGLARTFQITRPLKELTAVENAMVGAHIHTRRRAAARELAMDRLAFVGLADEARTPAGDLTIGDQKRLELARATAIDPTVLLLDEIMAGLTPSETAGMLDLFRELRAAGTSLLVIEHDMQAIMDISDRVAVLDSGRRIALGPPEAVAADDQVIEAYIGDHDAP